ncbi:methyltransferase domain-containing protein [Azospirillum sp. Sh1]|uniref:class I SAM-dependent methyltransferase n=1 Tax=Azospirillum sp. Sh1 TaxID=2607285 RepID=UPI00165E35B0|nr:methyltransferase domain-containing protein [Azospirillum sp. Sh1]
MTGSRCLWKRMRRILGRMPGGGHLVAFRRFLRGTDARYASLRRRAVPGLFQPFATTELDRYPDLFRYVLLRLGNGPGLRLLSFGCSTGEEVFSLRRYFPSAVIRGLDINPRNIARCRIAHRRSANGSDDGPDDRLSFALASDAGGEPAESYDAVFAMAVYRHGELGSFPPRCGHLIRFAAFEESVAGLAACLKPGGLLVLRHANFRFADTAAAAGFELLLEGEQHPDTPVYGRDETLLRPLPLREGVVFRKRASEPASVPAASFTEPGMA